MPDSSKSYPDVENINSAEFRTQMQNWIKEQYHSTDQQLQMKKNLIDQISQTKLGKSIALKLQTQQGIVLSPLVLVLNTLVAEFLYNQNCHFTLSIFSNEVPFKNTLPNFARSEAFRLTRMELKEIFEALGIKHHSGLTSKYENGEKEPEGGRSLLYIVFKSILSSVHSYEERLRKSKTTDKQKRNAKAMLQELHVEKLHRNVEKLLEKAKSMRKGIEQLEGTQRAFLDQGKDQLGEEDANSLKFCTENVSKVVERLEQCSVKFEQFIFHVQKCLEEEKQQKAHENIEKRDEEPEKSYNDFLHELKSTKHGKKYVAKLQKQIMKLLDKEKALIEGRYEKKLHELQLEHKVRVEQLLSAAKRESPKAKDITLVTTVDSRGNEESRHFMQKIDEKLNQLYQQEKNVDEKLATLRTDLHRQEQRQSRYFETLKAAKTKEKKLQVLHDVERELLATFEDETQAIIQNAKRTIQSLETESDKINHSFQRYLEKQREDKQKLLNEKMQIWQRYNDEKLEFNQRELLEVNTEVPMLPVTVHIPTFYNDPEQQNIVSESTFKNPFKNFDPLKYLKSLKPPERVGETTANTTVETEQITVVEYVPPLAKSPIGPSVSEVPLPAQRPTLEQATLTEALAKDTLSLKNSIEKNLQKLDLMSKSYSKGEKSSSSSDQRKTYTVEKAGTATTQPQPNDRNVTDFSSSELELSEGEVNGWYGRPKLTSTNNNAAPPKLDTTRELLDFAIPTVRDGQKVAADREQIAASISDLTISSDSESLVVPISKSKSLQDELDRISTGVRSAASENSWT